MICKVAHAYVFGHHEHTYGFYQLRNEENAAEGVIEAEMEVAGAFRDMLNVKDVMEDFHSSAIHAKQSGRKFREKTFMQRAGEVMDGGIELTEFDTVVNSHDTLSDSEEQTLLGGSCSESNTSTKDKDTVPVAEECQSASDLRDPANIALPDSSSRVRARAASMLDQASETLDADFEGIGTF